MTNKIIQFPVREMPHMTGEAVCLQCKHEWQAVTPIGITEFECPNCSVMKGVFKYNCQPDGEKKIFMCNCGNTYFVVTENSHLCALCGVETYL